MEDIFKIRGKVRQLEESHNEKINFQQKFLDGKEKDCRRKRLIKEVFDLNIIKQKTFNNEEFLEYFQDSKRNMELFEKNLTYLNQKFLEITKEGDFEYQTGSWIYGEIVLGIFQNLVLLNEFDKANIFRVKYGFVLNFNFIQDRYKFCRDLLNQRLNK